MTQSEPEVTAAASAHRPLVAIGLGVVALVVVTVAAVLILGGRSATAFPADSPEGAVQRYLAAFEDGDYAAAYGFFSSDVQERVTLEEYESTASGYTAPYGPDTSRRILFDRTSGDGERVTVHLTVEEFYEGGPFGGGETVRSERSVVTVREGGAWRIDQPLIWLDPGPFPEI